MIYEPKTEENMEDQIQNKMYGYTRCTAVKDDASGTTYTLWDDNFTHPVAEHLSVAELKAFVIGYQQGCKA